MNFLRNMSIKNKLITIILSVVLLSIIAGLTINIIQENADLKKKMVNQSMMNAKLVSEYCITPLDFGYQDEAEAIVEGRYIEGGSFEANNLLLKCPSKYEGAATATAEVPAK